MKNLFSFGNTQQRFTIMRLFLATTTPTLGLSKRTISMLINAFSEQLITRLGPRAPPRTV